MTMMLSVELMTMMLSGCVGVVRRGCCGKEDKMLVRSRVHPHPDVLIDATLDLAARVQHSPEQPWAAESRRVSLDNTCDRLGEARYSEEALSTRDLTSS